MAGLMRGFALTSDWWPVSAPRAGLHVLIADDCQYVSGIVAKQLQLLSPGCKVTTCADGVAAIAAIRALHKDLNLALIDNEMPNMGGLELIQEVRLDEKEKHMRPLVIACITFIWLIA